MPAAQPASCTTPRVQSSADFMVVCTPSVVSGPCKRPAATLLFATSGRPFRVALPGHGVTESDAMLIAPGQLRSLDAQHCDLLSINIEPGHPRYGALRQLAGNAAMRRLDASAFAGLRGALRNGFDGGGAGSASLVDAVLDAAGAPQQSQGTRVDGRITAVLAQVHAALPGKVPVAVLAAVVGLSEDRLSHLFVDTIGMPLRSYIVWQRYKLALQQLARGANLSELACNCGFSDAAHMTRTFVDFFGFAPSLLLRSGFIQDTPAAA